MVLLTQQHCTSCSTGATKISEQEQVYLAKQLPGWDIEERDDVLQLERVFKFKNFKQALAFTNLVAAMAETEGHHPALLTEWGKVTVTWWTHEIHGLHQNDFICAAQTDHLYDQSTSLI